MLMQSREAQHTERDRLSVILVVTMASATLFRFVELPTVVWGMWHIFGSPLQLSFGGDWLLALLMVGLVASGAFSLLQGHPHYDTRERPLIFSLITPALGTLLASLLLIRATSVPVWLVTLVLSGIFIGLLIHLNYRAFSPDSPGYTGARTMLNIADYLLGFALSSLILREQERALITGPAIMVLIGLLAFDLLSASGAQGSLVWLFGGIIAVLIGEMAWVLGYWPISTWTAGTMLTLELYLLSGLSYQYLLGRLTRRVLAEFGIVALVMFMLVLWIRP
ncbi:MAG TPA: hypothetical protein PLH19_00015 [Anaerolineae bacterium]|nr:hypothetical protein [Anaerolineae bacterium]HQH36905.1 hypothetical protein [Anaerolineae bacterium]